MIQLPKEVSDFLQTFKKEGFLIYVVGGAIRDLLLDHKTENWDFTTNATPEEILKLYPIGFYNNEFGTVGIPIKTSKGELIFEVTTFRKEGEYSDTRHPDTVVWADSVEEDLARRDFTINAIAYDGKTFVDPFGGREDIKKKLIVAVGDPDKRFKEDALRMMRGIRFTAELGFLIEDKTRLSIQKNAELITKISWERIRDELFKVLASDHPAEGVLFMRNTGLLTFILPEVDLCFVIPQKSPKRHHIYDVGTHLIMSLKHCPATEPIVRFAALLHDIGKAATFRKDEKTEIITFYNHEVIGAKLTEEIANRLKLSNKDKDRLVTLVKHHQFTVSEIQTDKSVRRFIRDIGAENIEAMLAVRTADRIGSGATPTSWRLDLFKKRLAEVQKIPFQIKDLKVSGHDVMKILNLKPGREIGKILASIFNDVEEGKVVNEKDALLKEIKKYLEIKRDGTTSAPLKES